jgi:GT2 family glycosyltransferase
MSNSAPLVAIVILNWNNWRDTLECISACRKLEWPNFCILLVDNHSTDGSTEMLRSACPELEIIETEANLGFAGGNNIGIRQALNLGADYIWLLNNDATPAPDALAPLVGSLQKHPSAACAASKIYYHDNPQRIWFAGGAWSRGYLRLRQAGACQIDRGQFDDVREIGSVSGCSMLMPADIIRSVGMLTAEYFLYWEDTDWSARAQKLGYQLLFAPDSHVWHKVSATITPRSALQYYYYVRNGLYFCCRHDLLSLPLLLLYTTVDVCVGLLRGNFQMASGYIRGIADFVRGRRGQQVEP